MAFDNSVSFNRLNVCPYQDLHMYHMQFDSLSSLTAHCALDLISIIKPITKCFKLIITGIYCLNKKFSVRSPKHFFPYPVYYK